MQLGLVSIRGGTSSTYIQEQEGEAPDLQVESWAEKSAQGEGFRNGIAAISVDTSNDEVALRFGEKAPSRMRVLRESNEEDIGCDCNGTRYHAFHDEDPSPASETALAAHLHQPVGHNSRQGRSGAAD